MTSILEYWNFCRRQLSKWEEKTITQFNQIFIWMIGSLAIFVLDNRWIWIVLYLLCTCQNTDVQIENTKTKHFYYTDISLMKICNVQCTCTRSKHLHPVVWSGGFCFMNMKLIRISTADIEMDLLLFALTLLFTLNFRTIFCRYAFWATNAERSHDDMFTITWWQVIHAFNCRQILWNWQFGNPIKPNIWISAVHDE